MPVSSEILTDVIVRLLVVVSIFSVLQSVIVKLLSNSLEVLKGMNKQCANNDRTCDEQHRHAELTRGRARQCQVYPRDFCRAVCAGVAAQKKLRDLGMMAVPIMSLEEMLSTVPAGEGSDNPSEDLHERDAGYMAPDGTVAFDDQSGAPLKPELVTKARKEEIPVNCSITTLP